MHIYAHIYIHTHTHTHTHACTHTHTHRHIYIYIYICVWSGRPVINSRLSLAEDSKMVLDAAFLNTQNYKVRIKGKVEQAREQSSAFPYTSV